jgi:hypothetical protein
VRIREFGGVSGHLGAHCRQEDLPEEIGDCDPIRLRRGADQSLLRGCDPGGNQPRVLSFCHRYLCLVLSQFAWHFNHWF